VAVVTTARGPSPETITGLPRSPGRRSSYVLTLTTYADYISEQEREPRETAQARARIN